MPLLKGYDLATRLLGVGVIWPNHPLNLRPFPGVGIKQTGKGSRNDRGDEVKSKLYYKKIQKLSLYFLGVVLHSFDKEKYFPFST